MRRWVVVEDAAVERGVSLCLEVGEVWVAKATESAEVSVIRWFVVEKLTRNGMSDCRAWPPTEEVGVGSEGFSPIGSWHVGVE
jgi:hypothetical protein